MNHYEKRVLGFILSNRSEAVPILNGLKLEYMSDTPARDILNCILSWYELKKEIISPERAAKALQTNEAVLKDLCYEAFGVSLESAEEYTRLIREEHLKEKYRQLMLSAEEPDELKKLSEQLSAELTGKQKVQNMREYLSGSFQKELDENRKRGIIKTGLDNFDEELNGLYAGLYVVGAISSLGKTTLIHQIADSIAGTGTPVLYFSLEMSRLELVTKSISRITALNALQAGRKNLDEVCRPSVYYRSHGLDEAGKEALKQYTETIADNLTIIEGDFGIDVFQIRQQVQRFSRNNPAPVVIIDYLQIMKPAQSGTTKESIDLTVSELKRLSRDFNIPVIVISSFNRQNYITPVAFESFKESGGIEYTADVVIGLQLNVLNEEIFGKDGHIKEKRNRIDYAKQENPRKIQLMVLKNRYGQAVSDLQFEYNPLYDVFTPAKRIQDTVYCVTADTPKGFRPNRKKKAAEQSGFTTDYSELIEIK